MEKAGAAILRGELDAAPYHAMSIAAAVYRAMNRVAEKASRASGQSAPQSDMSRPT
jgi:hypothetical protein